MPLVAASFKVVDPGVVSKSYFSTMSGVQRDETCRLGKRKVEVGEQLLPGIPDEIIINKISLRLPWRAFYELSRVSRSWQQAIRSRQVYDARVRSKSTETFVAFNHEFNHEPNDLNKTISFYSVKEPDRSYNLPPIPGHSRGIPWFCGRIFLDGKLYIFGGCRRLDDDPTGLDDNPSGDEVYVFDIAGHKQWKRCASMDHRRGEFGCCVMDGKIYVIGGRNEKGPVHGAEVYDPMEDSWSPITPMPSLGFNQTVTAVGDELFVHVYGGGFYDSDFVWTGLGDQRFDHDDDHIHLATSAEVYHPKEDEWRTVKHFTVENDFGVLTVVGGKLHKMDNSGTHVYDIQANSWKMLQLDPCDEPGQQLNTTFATWASVGVDESKRCWQFWTILIRNYMNVDILERRRFVSSEFKYLALNILKLCRRTQIAQDASFTKGFPPIMHFIRL